MTATRFDSNNRHPSTLVFSTPAPGVEVSVVKGSSGPFLLRVRRSGHLTGEWPFESETRARVEFERKVEEVGNEFLKSEGF
jgi:hypothetical protein